MQDQIPVSVIIPCFNHGLYLREAIASVEQCDSSLYEIIIINDGSTDAYTIQVLRELESRGYNVVNQANQGLGASRNNGIRISRGRYILPLDADNRIRAEYIPKGVKILDEYPGVSVVYGKPAYFGEVEISPSLQVTKFSLRKLLNGNFIDACALFRKSAWEECGGYDVHMPFQGVEDWDFWITLAIRGHGFHFIDEILFDYRVRPNSMRLDMQDSIKIGKNIEYLSAKHSLFKIQKLHNQVNNLNKLLHQRKSSSSASDTQRMHDELMSESYIEEIERALQQISLMRNSSDSHDDAINSILDILDLTTREHLKMLEQQRRLFDLELFLQRVQSNPVFKMYHWLKYLGRK